MRWLLLTVAVFACPAMAAWVDDCGLEPPGSVPYVPVEPKPWEPVSSVCVEVSRVSSRR